MTFRLAVRIALCAFVALTGYMAWATRFNSPTLILLCIGTFFLSREIYKSKLSPNPLGEKRNFALQPALMELGKSGICFAGSLLWWTLAVALAVRYRAIPDNRFTAYGLLLIPMSLMLVSGAWYFVLAALRALYGNPTKV